MGNRTAPRDQRDGRDRHPDTLMAPIDYARYVPATLLEPPPVAVLPHANSYLQVPYAEVLGWRPLRLDLHVPSEPSGPVPAVVYVHGGSFLAGMPTMGPWTSLPARGIAVASVSYRFSGEAPFPEPVEDVRAAVTWLQANAERFGVDAERVAIWGSSAGGYLAAMVAATGRTTLGRPPRILGGQGDAAAMPRPLTAAVTHYAVTEPAALRADAFDNTEDDIADLEAVMAAFFGEADRPTAIRQHLADPLAVPPFLVMHGDTDRRVGFAQGQRLHRALGAAGVTSTFVRVAGAGHGTPEWETEAVVGQVEAFLRNLWSRRPEQPGTPPSAMP